MDYRTLSEAIPDMNDEQLLSIEKKAGEERKRRLAVNLGTPQPGQRLLIDFAPVVNGVREGARKELRVASEAVLASV